MKDRSLRNDDIQGTKPKTYGKRNLLRPQDQPELMYYNEEIQQPNYGNLNIDQKNYRMQNNIYGYEGMRSNQFNQKEPPRNFAMGNANMDSLDKFSQEFQVKKNENPKIQQFQNVENVILQKIIILNLE